MKISLKVIYCFVINFCHFHTMYHQRLALIENILVQNTKNIKLKEIKIKKNLMRDFIDFIKYIVKDGNE